jgi:hypothetical protein
MPSRSDKRNTQQGYIQAFALVLILLLSASGLAFLNKSLTERKTSANFRNGLLAQYLAEAGIQYARAWLIANGTPTASSSLPPLQLAPNSVCHIRFRHGSFQTHKVSSLASVGSSQKRMSAVICRTDAYDCALCAEICVFPGAHIQGTIRSYETANAQHDGLLPQIVFNTVNRSPLPDHPQYRLDGGDYFHKGDLTLCDGSITGSGTLLIDGSLYCEKTASIDGNIVIMTTKSIVIRHRGDKVSSNRALLIANDNIEIHCSGDSSSDVFQFMGALIAGNTVSIDGNVYINYDGSMVENFRNNGKLPIVSAEQSVLNNWTDRKQDETKGAT